MKPVPDKPKAAFPLHTEFSTQFGMDLRDWFAGMALQGLLACDSSGNCRNDAFAAYACADAMLAQRGEEE